MEKLESIPDLPCPFCNHMPKCCEVKDDKGYDRWTYYCANKDCVQYEENPKPYKKFGWQSYAKRRWYQWAVSCKSVINRYERQKAKQC